MANRYLQIFEDPETEQARLLLQAQLAASYIQDHAPRFLPQPPARILDLGTGPGFLALELHALYPTADLIGIDNNPAAIARASARLAATPAPQVHFVVGDIQHALPPGPFDLIYGSLIFFYLTDLPRTVALIYQALAPGGTLWIKELRPGAGRDTPDPDYHYLTDHLYASLRQAGYQVDLVTALPPLLHAAGFRDITLHEDESYPIGGPTIEGETFLLNILAGLHGSRKLISRMRGLAEEEIDARLQRFIATAQASPEPLTYYRPVNILARRPAP